jgi:sortase (surface protein transpeptidase)
MHNMSDITMLIKKAALDAVNEAKPTSIVFGQVTGINPLKISIDQKLILTSEQLILTNNVRDYNVEMTVDHFTESSSGGSGESSFASHNHAYSGKKTFMVHNGLVIGDQVIMIQVQGGQKFIILEKVVIE